MMIILFFLLFTFIEFVILFVKWNEITDAQQMGKISDKKYTSTISLFVIFLQKKKTILWVIFGLMLITNVLIGVTLSAAIEIILYFI